MKELLSLEVLGYMEKNPPGLERIQKKAYTLWEKREKFNNNEGKSVGIINGDEFEDWITAEVLIGIEDYIKAKKKTQT